MSRSFSRSHIPKPRRVPLSTRVEYPLDHVVLVRRAEGGSNSHCSNRPHIWIHYPTLLRMLRLGSTYKLGKVLLDVARGMPEESIGLLIPGMLALCDERFDKRVRKVAKDVLATITKHENQTNDSYKQWYEDWQTAHAAGRCQGRSKADDCVAIYKRAEQARSVRAWLSSRS